MRRPVLAAVVLLAGSAVLPALAAANHTGLPTALADATTGAASWGVRVDADATGHFAVQVTGCGTKVGSTDGIGMLLFDASKQFRFGVMVTGGFSTDRRVVSVGDMDLVHEVTYPAFGGVCPYARLEFEVQGAPGATHYLVGWVAGLDGASRLDVFGGAGTQAQAQRGDALALGDSELRGGTQVQLQQRLVGFHGVGAKLLVGAHAEQSVQRSLYGAWSYSDTKFACMGTCVGSATVDTACDLVLGVSCVASLGWQGPAGAGTMQAGFLFLGEPPGAYTFTVERKVDAYDPAGVAFVPPGVLVALTENYSYLSVADVALPP